MAFSLIPKEYYTHTTKIDPKRLKEECISLLLLDLDNTLALYGAKAVSPEIAQWLEDVKAAGITPFILSNSRKKTRVQSFATPLKLDYIRHAGKPKQKGYLEAMEKLGKSPEDCAMVGDQIFTDILGGNRASMKTILVKPLRMDTLFRVLRFMLEAPFRILGKKIA